MRSPRKLLLCSVLIAVSGCRQAQYAPPEFPLPPNTILLSGMMRELSAQPGFTEAMLAELDKGSKKGPALLTPRLIDDLRSRILGKDWAGLDRFPGWTMREINPTVRIVGHVAGKNDKLEDASAVHPGAPLGTASGTTPANTYLDLGPYALDKAETVSLDRPSTLPGFTTEGIVSTLGAGVTRGDGPNELAPEHAESQRLADVLNRLAANQLDGVALLSAVTGTHAIVNSPNHSPAKLIEGLQAEGYDITVQDARYFANFGHFHYKGEDVMMPFWVDSGLIVPHTDTIFRRGRHLLVPVSHAEYEWHIRAPKGRPGINADVSYYFGIDGKSEWRTMDTLDQPWVLKRNAHTYTGAQAVEVTRLASLLTVAYMHQHVARPALPFGGYYALGVCQDGVSAIEKKMTGKVTLFPNTADAELFNDPRDAEANALIAAIPKDREGATPEPSRVFGSLPVDPGPSADYSAVTIPGLAADLQAAHFAWGNGSLKTVHHHVNLPLLIAVLIICIIAGSAIFRHRNLKDFQE